MTLGELALSLAERLGGDDLGGPEPEHAPRLALDGRIFRFGGRGLGPPRRSLTMAGGIVRVRVAARPVVNRTDIGDVRAEVGEPAAHRPGEVGGRAGGPGA